MNASENLMGFDYRIDANVVFMSGKVLDGIARHHRNHFKNDMMQMLPQHTHSTATETDTHLYNLLVVFVRSNFFLSPSPSLSLECVCLLLPQVCISTYSQLADGAMSLASTTTQPSTSC